MHTCMYVHMYMYICMYTETTLQPVSLSQDSVDDGLMFRQCVQDRIVDSRASNQQILASDEETEIQDLLTGMGSKEKRRMLRYYTYVLICITCCFCRLYMVHVHVHVYHAKFDFTC